MKIIPAIFFFLFFITAYNWSQDGFLEAYLAKWDNSAKFTLECAELMPEEDYDFMPTPEEMSFRKQLLHILQNMLWLSTDYLDLGPFYDDLRKADPNKQELIAILKKAISDELLSL